MKTLRTIIAGFINAPEVRNEILKRTDELNWSAIFNSAIAGSSWFKKPSLYPGRWAAGYPFLYILFRVYNDIRPKKILEFGLGETSKLSYQYIEAYPESRLVIIEQDLEWLNYFSSAVHNVIPNTIPLNIEYKIVNGFETKVYQGLIEKISSQKFDLIIVDGPYGSDHYSRYQVVDVVENNLLSEDFVIIVDDYERKGEQETVAKVRKVLKSKNITFIEGTYHGIKSTILICSEKFKFLISM